MNDLKQAGEGLSFDGVYTLQQWIRDDQTGSFFSAGSDEGEELLVKLMPDVGADADVRMDVWQRSRHLRHANVMHLYDCGRVEIAERSYIYAVFERPDDVLASAVEAGPLEEEETRGVVTAVIAALRYLHGQGLVHGAVDPSHVVAVGDTVKLATDVLRESDDLEGHAEDVRQLGQLIHTLRAPNRPGEELALVARHALEPDPRQRWTLAEISASLEKKPAPVEVPPAVEAPPDAAVAAVEETAAEATPVPAATEAPVLPPPHRREIEPAAPPMRFPRWIFGGVAAVLLIILVVNIRRKPEAVPPPRSTPSTAPVERVIPPPAVRPTPPAPRSEAARQEDPKPSPLEPAGLSKSAVWRVIAFTYTSRDMASKKARQLNERWPDLHASVFSPKDRRGYFLVALGGGRMKRDEAADLQRRARGLGLPRDVYVQNYSE